MDLIKKCLLSLIRQMILYDQTIVKCFLYRVPGIVLPAQWDIITSGIVTSHACDVDV